MLGKLNYLLCMLGFLLFFGPQAGITSALGAPGAVEEEKSEMMIDRLEGNSELKTSVRLMLGGRRMTHSVLLVGEEGLGTGFAARCVAADYLYPNGGAPAEACSGASAAVPCKGR